MRRVDHRMPVVDDPITVRIVRVLARIPAAIAVLVSDRRAAPATVEPIADGIPIVMWLAARSVAVANLSRRYLINAGLRHHCRGWRTPEKRRQRQHNNSRSQSHA